MIKGVRHIFNIYQSRGINIAQINCYNEFKCIDNDVLPIKLNVVAAEEHVGDIERENMTLKEGTRSQVNSLPYTHYPRAMVAGCAVYVNQLLNMIPSNSGISDIHSPSTLVTDEPAPDYHEVTKLRFGDYVHTTHGQTKNDNTSRTTGAIALYPSKNMTGG